MHKCIHPDCFDDNISFITRRPFIYHLKKYHKLTPEEYSQKFLSKIPNKCIFCEDFSSWDQKKWEYRDICSKKSCICKKGNANTRKNLKKKYGLSSVFGLKNIQEKIRKTKIEKYDDPNWNNSQKNKKTSLKNWGVDNPSKSKEIKIKISESMKKVDKILQQERIKKTNFERYGVEHASQSEEVQNKIKLRNILEYGVDHPMKNKKFLDKYKNNLHKKFGVINVSQIDGVKEKIRGKKFENRKKRLYKKFGNRIKGFPDNYTVEIECTNCLKNSKLNIAFLEQRHRFNTDLCIHCTPYNIPSYAQIEINDWINKSLGVETIMNYRLKTNKEIDIFIPSLNIGIEYNGIYWHSEIYKDKDYHKDKKKDGLDEGINIINLWEDDYLMNKEKIQCRLRNLLGISQKIYARKCFIKEISSIESKKFLDNYHLHNNINASIRLGLFYEEGLISVITFGRRNGLKKNEYEIFRFASKFNYHIIGGFSKLLSHFIKKYNPEKIITFLDLDWANGTNNVYEKNGFTFINQTPVDYYWVINKKRVNRHNFMKHKLIKEGYNINKSEKEIMHERGFFRIYGVGNLKYEWKNTK